MTALTITSNGTAGYSIPAAANPVTVASGVTLTNTNLPAVYDLNSTYVTISNYGLLRSTGANVYSEGILLFNAGGTVTNASGGYVAGYYAGVSISGFGSIVNAGTMYGTGTYHGFGVRLTSGGSVTNTHSGVISGGLDGILTVGEASTVINQGYIGGIRNLGVGLVAGGTLSNASGDTIYGGRLGVYAGSANAMTLTNDGLIIGHSVVGAVLLDGGVVNNQALGKISGYYDGLYTNGTTAATVTNAGTLYGFASTGAWLNAGGTLSNSGSVSGRYYGVKVVTDPGTVSNTGSISTFGTFQSTDTAFASAGVLLTNGGVVTNNAGGTIASHWTGIEISNAPGTVMNTGVISGVVQSLPANTTLNPVGVQLADGGVVTNAAGGTIAAYSVGIQIFNGSGTVVNAGSISASATLQSTDTIFSATGVQLVGGGVVTNLTHADINANWIGVQINGIGASIINQGTINAARDGIYTDGAGASTVNNSGTLNGTGYAGAWLDSGGSVTNSGTVFGQYFGIKVSNVGSVLNTGNVSDTELYNGAGIQLTNGGVVTNVSGGYIKSEWMGVQIGSSPATSVGGTVINQGIILAEDFKGDGAGVWIHGPGAISNASGGLISGGAFGIVAYYQTTVVNQGTVFGTEYAFSAVKPGFADRIIDQPGGLFSGIVSGGNTLGSAIYSTLELASGSSTGTIVNIGTFVDFGRVALDAGATWSVGGSITTGETVGFGGTHTSLILTTPSAFAGGTITGFVATDTIVLSGITDVTGVSPGAGNTVIVHESGSPGVTLQFATPTILNYAAVTGATDLFVAPCFLPGTHILTDCGEVLVEKLRVGDTIVTLAGHTRRLCWIGQGRALATRGRRSAATPVIVRKGALADNVPHLDLHITKGHSLYLDGVLIPVEFLVNHRSILWDDRAQEVTVFHLELDTHDVLIANGVAAESYRDDGNRWLFQNANDGWDQPPKAPCAPVLTGGARVDAIWRRILDRAGPRPGQPLTDDPDLHLLVDGVRVDATEQEGPVRVFRLTGRPQKVCIASREVIPAELGLARDARSLGVALRRIVVRKGTKFVVLKASDATLADGFHPYEPADDLRWTDGRATLPAEPFAGFKGAVEVVLHLAATTQYRNDGVEVAA